MKHVIIGAGPAGLTAAETLRDADPSAEIILIGGETHPPYSRMAIPYVLTGKIESQGTYLRQDQGHLENMGIEYVSGRVSAVNVDKGEVALSDGSALAYDRLLVATGSTPVSPPIAGMDLDGVHHCWTLEDVAAIAARAKKGSNVVLMGAGFIGCIILESLVERGVNLTVVEAEDRMIARMMDQVGGGLLKDWVKGKGVNLMTLTKVTGIVQNGAALTVSTDRGEDLAADIVVVSVGVKPNIDFLHDSGVETDTGILVNDRLHSSIEGIYAAGDVAQGPGFGGGFEVHAVQPTSVDHGRIAGLNMAGTDTKYQGSLMMNVLDTLGLVTASFGDWSQEKDTATQLNADKNLYIKLAFDKDVLIGALSIGRTDQIGVLRGLIQSRIKLGAWKQKLIANPSLIADAYVACLCA